MHIPAHESLRQIRGMLAEVRKLRPIKFVIFDNGCGLACHCRNQARATRTPMAQTLASLTYVIDEYHYKKKPYSLQGSL